MGGVSRPQQQRGRVDRAARDDEERRLDANRLAVAARLRRPRLVRPAPSVSRRRAQALRPQRDVRPRDRRTDAAHVGFALRVQLAGERVARVAEDAALVAEPSGSGEGCSPWRRSASTISAMPAGVRNRGDRETARAAARSDRRRAARARGTDVRRARRTARACRSRSARPARRRRRARPPGSPRGAADRARCPRTWCCRRRSSACTGGTPSPVLVEPALLRPVAEVLPHRFRDSSSRPPGHEIAALEDQDAGRGRRQRVRHRAAACAAADDDDVVAFGGASGAAASTLA